MPEAPYGYYTFNGAEVPERATIGHAEVVKFSCREGYSVLGSDTLRCWYGEWTVTGASPECQPGEPLLCLPLGHFSLLYRYYSLGFFPLYITWDSSFKSLVTLTVLRPCETLCLLLIFSTSLILHNSTP